MEIIATNGIEVTLPDPFERRRPIYIKRNSASNITIKRYGTETIDGSASDLVISFDKESKTLVSDGTNWWII